MTSLDYGLDMPYEVQLEHHAATSTTHMTILEPQRSPGQPATRHLLTPGVYMVSLAYNGAAAATLQHVGGGTTNAVSVTTGVAGMPRTSAPIKISVQGTTEYLHVAAPSTGGTARATISVIPAATFDEMAESAQGVLVLSEISNLKSTKADKSTLDARVPANTALRLDTSVGTRIFAGDTMIHGDTGWRNMGSEITSQITIDPGGKIMARRVEERVYWKLLGVRLAAVTSDTNMVAIPIGFRQTEARQVLYTGSTDKQPSSLAISSSMWFLRYRGSSAGLLSDADFSINLTYTTDNVWPAALPGIPA